MSTTIPFSPISSTQLVPSCNEEVGRAEFTSGSLSLLMNKNLIYCGGQYIEGSVTLNLDSNTFIRGIWVKFSGLNTINKTKYSGNKIINSDLFNNHEDYHCGGIHEVLFGFGEENDTSNENFNLIEFSRGKRSWPFSFFIPESSPLSYCDDYTELIYSITAVVDAAEIPIAMTHVTYHPIIGTLRQDNENLYNKNIFGKNGNKLESIIKQPNGCQPFFIPKIFKNVFDNKNCYLSIESLSEPAIFDFKNLNKIIKAKVKLNQFKSNKTISLHTELFAELIIHDEGNNKGKKNKIVHEFPIWSKKSYFRLCSSENRKDSYYECLIDIPVKIDTYERNSSQKEWPRPTSINHTSGSIRNFTTSGPLFDYTVKVRFSAVSVDNPLEYEIDNIISDRNCHQVCSSCSTEIYINAPISTSSTTLHYYTHPDQIPITPRAMTNKVINISNTKKIVGKPPKLKNSTSNKITTPHANLVIPRVNAEPVSQGPAAFLVDRTRHPREESFTTPRRFAPLYSVGQNVIVMDVGVAIPRTPTSHLTPPMASIYQLPLDNEVNEPESNDELVLNTSLELNDSIDYDSEDNNDRNYTVGTPAHVIGVRRILDHNLDGIASLGRMRLASLNPGIFTDDEPEEESKDEEENEEVILSSLTSPTMTQASFLARSSNNTSVTNFMEMMSFLENKYQVHIHNSDDLHACDIQKFNVLLELSQNQSLPRISSSQAMTLLVLFKTQLMKEKALYLISSCIIDYEEMLENNNLINIFSQVEMSRIRDQIISLRGD